MEIRQIRYAAEIARSGSFSKASHLLFVTQQTLSQQVRKLEDEIGFEIFERSTRTVKLTQKGKIFIEKAENLLSVYDSFERDVETLKASSAEIIRLGILPTFQHLNILENIYSFQAYETDVTVQAQIQKSSRLIEMMDHGTLDAAIGNLSHEQMEIMKDEYMIHVFSKDHVCAIIHSDNPLASKKEVRLSDLSGQTLLMLERGSSIRSRLETVMKEKKMRHGETIECPEIYSMIGMIQSGYGIGFLSSQVAAKVITKDLKALPLTPEMETITVMYYFKNHDKKDILKKLAEHLAKQL